MTVQAGERTPFIGREPELAHLRRLLDRAVVGRGGLALIAGDPGIGKTRLAQEAVAEAASRGVRPLTGHCVDRRGSPPYLPFVEILETLQRHLPPTTFRHVLGNAAGEMARLLPGLRHSWPALPAPLELPPEQERRYLFNCFAEVLLRVSNLAPLMLVLEDLQWADEATLLLLEHVSRHVAETPLLILGTYRDRELDLGSGLAGTLERLLRSLFSHRLMLRFLGIAETAEMLFALSGQNPPASAVMLVHRAGEGNPFFTEELFHHLADEGLLLNPNGHWRSAPTAPVSVPPGVRLVIEQRLRRLTNGVRDVLVTAAAIGPVFGFALMQELVDMDDEALLQVLEEAERAHLVVSTVAAQEASFGFVHELIRQTLLERLSSPRRQALHIRVADALERLHAGQLAEHAPDIALQLLQAGSAADAGRSIRFLRWAGDRALGAVAFEDAQHWAALPAHGGGAASNREALHE